MTDADPDPDHEPASEGAYHLTADIVEDDEQLGQAVDAITHLDVEARERLSEIVRYEDALKAAMEPDLYPLFLRVQALSTARWSDVMVTIAKWAFYEGVREGSMSKGGST